MTAGVATVGGAAAAAAPATLATPATPPTPAAAKGTAAPYSTHLPTGRFGTVSVYIPEGTPRSVAIFVSGDGGWELGVVSMAHALTDLGAVVIGVDIRPISRACAGARSARAHPAR